MDIKVVNRAFLIIRTEGLRKFIATALGYAKLIIFPKSKLEVEWDSVNYHRKENVVGKVGISATVSVCLDDLQLLERIAAAYRRAVEGFGDVGDSMWAQMARRNNAVHAALVANDIDVLVRVFADPFHYYIFCGFDSTLEETKLLQRSVAEHQRYAYQVYDKLRRLGEAMGALRLDNPETYNMMPPDVPDIHCILEKIDIVLGWKVDFPNPYPNEYGLETDRGVASYRAVQALYQAWRIKELLKDTQNPSVLEISAGLGRTAYYAYRLGIKRYTIIDLPITGVSQSHFLSHTLGDDAIKLYGETGEGIAILPPKSFYGGYECFNIALNADSLTEMDIDIARMYWKEIEQRVAVFLSINHESNLFTVRDLIGGSNEVLGYSRNPYWMRRGYVEEVIQINRL